MTTQQAIRFLRNSQRSHAAWVEFYKSHPKEEREYSKVAGNLRCNARLVRRYQEVIDLLTSAPRPGTLLP